MINQTKPIKQKPRMNTNRHEFKSFLFELSGVHAWFKIKNKMSLIKARNVAETAAKTALE
ncbi:MAG: hypothetical protein D4R63_06385 [Methylococcaceae bacterium]|nr:MAG: hypothetical protein D4R63_06385 [Methylococcaceae bacterium]